MEKMLVTAALNELKLLDSRIDRHISEARFVDTAKKSADKVEGRKLKTKYMADSKSALQSIHDLIERRKKIKAAVVASNAVTKVEIGGVTMTVADAIERKTSIEYDKDLMYKMEAQFADATRRMTKENEKVQASVDKLLETAYGKDQKDKVTAEMHDVIAKPYREANEYAIVEGFDVESEIKKMKDEIETFLSEVDIRLQVSNSTTYIEF